MTVSAQTSWSAGVSAVVLAGGPGSRLEPIVSDEHPKALLPVATKPLIHHPLSTLLQNRVGDVTVVAAAPYTDLVKKSVADFRAQNRLDENDPEFTQKHRVVERAEEHDTADVLRALFADGTPNGHHVLVMSTDLVTNANLDRLFKCHFMKQASCSAYMIPVPTEEDNTDGPEVYITTDPVSDRLLAVEVDSDLENGRNITLRPTLLARFPTVRVRSDLRDLHVYMFAPWVLERLLIERPQISNVRYDLVPYLARRQFTLSRQAAESTWGEHVPRVRGQSEANVGVYCAIASSGTIAYRLNTLSRYQSTTLDLAAQQAAILSPAFASAGERTNLSKDSFVGAACTAGTRTSVKKSFLGNNVVLGDQVKLNKCIVLDDAVIEQQSNLTGTIVGPRATIGPNCTLKDCRVGADVEVSEATSAEGRDLGTGMAPETGEDLMDDFEFT